jgi:hypothetical protein
MGSGAGQPAKGMRALFRPIRTMPEDALKHPDKLSAKCRWFPQKQVMRLDSG